MKKISIISKSISHLLLLVMLYMHLCSALCAMGLDSCCEKEEVDNHHEGKSCCSHEKESGKKDNGCQNMHFSFFNVTGQFAQVKANNAFKSFQPLVAVITPLFIIQHVAETKSHFVSNGFHPPPPKEDIRIFIQSFQI